MELDLSLVGSASDPFEVEVEKGDIRRFATAIGDTNPLYFDEEYARAKGHAGLLAPPTFPTTFRPPQPPAWVRNLDARRIVAGQMAFTYERPIVSGMRLTCRMHFLGVDEKQGSKGRMQIIRQALEGHDESGALVFVAGRDTIYRSLEQVEKRSLA